MRALMRKSIHTWGYGKVLALFLGCLLFSLGGRAGAAPSFEQHILTAVSDHYYLTFFMMPMILLCIFPFVDDDSELVVMRFGSYHAYFYKKLGGMGILAFLLICVQTAAILLSGLGLETGNQWGIVGSATTAELFRVLGPYFSTPLLAFVSYSFYQFIGIWFTFGICLWIGHFAGRKWSVRLLIAVYLFAALWVKIPALQAFPLTGINHILILHHSLGTPGRFAITAITMIALSVMMMFSVRFFWRGIHFTVPRRKHHGITPYYIRELVTKKNVLILCAVITAVIFYKGLGNSGMVSGEEWLFVLFAGHGTGYFQMIPLLELLIVNGTPLYLLAAFIERAINEQSMFVSIRMKGRRELLLGMLSACMQFLALYATLWLLGAAAGTCFFGYGVNLAAGKMLLYAVVMKYMDILLQCLMIITIYLLCRRITVGFLMLIAGNLLCVIPAPGIEYLPFGLSSMTRIGILDIGIGITAQAGMMILALLTAVVFGWLLLAGHRKLLN